MTQATGMLRSDDTGKLILRLAVGMLLFHGIAKIGHGVEPIAGMLEAHGMPRFMAYGSYVGEFVAPILVLIGFLTRPAGAVIAFNMIVAIWLAHLGQFFSINDQTGGWAIELPMFYLLGGLALFFTGAGRFSASRGRGRWD